MLSEIAPPRFRSWITPTIAAAVFALLSLAMLPYPGFQDDELLFTVPIYEPGGALFSVRLFGWKIPLMLIGYLGAFKTWLYAAVLQFAAPSPRSIRVPVILAGMATVCLTWIWVKRIAGTRAAAFTVALLSTDAVFIVTNTFDWGPVAFQHLFLMGGLVAISSERNPKWLALGYFLWGVGLWDKALFIWPLIGLAVATLCVYPRHFRRTSTTAAFLLLGALPLIIYNVARHGDTASANAHLAIGQISRKTVELRKTLDGSVLLEAMVATTPGPIAQQPVTWVERLSVAARTQLGDHSRNLMIPALALSLGAMAFLFRKPEGRLLIFIVIATAVAWLQMAFNAGTGGGAHHVILLWPFPCMFVGIALAGMAERVPRIFARGIVGIVTLIAAANILNTNEYLADLIRNGAVGGWTDASYRLAGAMYPYRASPIGIVDWGYLNNLRMMYGGELKFVVLDHDNGSPLPPNLAAMAFIQHTDDQQLFAGVNGHLRDAARSLGYSEEVVRTVHDNQGRPIFEIFRFVQTP